MCHNGEQRIHCFCLCFYIHLNASQYDNTLFSFTLFLCLKYSFIFLHGTLVLSLYINISLTLSINIIDAWKSVENMYLLSSLMSYIARYISPRIHISSERTLQKQTCYVQMYYFHIFYMWPYLEPGMNSCYLIWHNGHRQPPHYQSFCSLRLFTSPNIVNNRVTGTY